MARITYADHPLSFYICLNIDKIGLGEFVLKHVQNLSQAALHDWITDPLPGSGCLVKEDEYDRFSQWHRAEIRKIWGFKCELRLVDIGSFLVADKTRLLKLPRALQNIPKLAIEVRLENLTVTHNRFESALCYTQTFGKDRWGLPISISVIRRDPDQVYVVESWEHSGQHLTTELKDLQFCSETKTSEVICSLL